MIEIDIQFFGGRGGGGSGGARGGRAGGGSGGRTSGGKTSMTAEQTLSAKDLALKGGLMGPALTQATEQANSLKNVGDYIEITKTLKDGTVEVSRMEVTGTAKYNDVYSRSPKPNNPDVPSVTISVPGKSTRTSSGVSHKSDLMNILLDKKAKTKSVTIRTYKRG